MNKQFSDDELIQLYQQNNDAMPPKHIDEAILAHAADAVNDENKKLDNIELESKARAHKATRISNQWWQYSGIAAAIVAVAVLAPWQYYQDPMLVSVESDEVPAILKAKQTQQSAPQIERTEILAEDAKIERIEVTGARLERAAPEQKALRRQAVSPVMYGNNLAEPDAEFKDILAKLASEDKAGAETALIKLLKEKPEYHEDIPESLEDLYQALVKNGKIERPITSSKSGNKSKNKN